MRRGRGRRRQGRSISAKQRQARKRNMAVARKFRWSKSGARGRGARKARLGGGKKRAAWNKFAKAANKEMGGKFKGSVTGAVRSKLSRSTSNKYKRYLASIGG